MNLINSTVIVKDKDSIYYNEWGRIIYIDDDLYYVAIADGKDSIPVFERSQLKIKK